MGRPKRSGLIILKIINILHFESPRVIGTAYVRFESEQIAITKHCLVVCFNVSPVVQTFFDAMTKVAAKIEVLVSHGFYGLIGGRKLKP